MAGVDLHSGERALFEGHPSWRSIISFYLMGLGAAVGAGVLAALVTRVADDEVRWGVVVLVALAVTAITILLGFIKRVTTVYRITNERLWIKRGLIARRVQQTRIDRVQNVNTDQSVVERILRIGSVDFDTAGTDDSDFRFEGVEEPEDVVAAVDRAQKEAPPGPGV